MTFVFNIKQEETMKKTYKNPEIVVVKIASQLQILAGSDLGMGSGDKNPATEADARFFDDDTFDFDTEESISDFEY